MDVWIASYRRRVIATVFPGRTGRRDQSVLLALAVVMAQPLQRERVIECTYSELVRVAAADHKTIRRAVESLRKGGFLRVICPGDFVDVGVWRGQKCKDRLWTFALTLEQLEPEPLTSSDSIFPADAASLSALVTGQMDNDAYGGRRGIKRGDLAVLRWLTDNLGATRYQIAQGVGISRPTASASIERLQKHGLVIMDEKNSCYLVEVANEQSLLQQITCENYLRGSQERRVGRAVLTFEVVCAQGKSGKAGTWGMPH